MISLAWKHKYNRLIKDVYSDIRSLTGSGAGVSFDSVTGVIRGQLYSKYGLSRTAERSFGRQITGRLKELISSSGHVMDQAGIEGIFIRGSFAIGYGTPFHPFQNGMDVGFHSYNIFRLWEIFLSAKGPGLDGGSDLDIIVFAGASFDDIQKDRVAEEIRSYLSSSAGYTPDIEIRVKSGSESLLPVALSSVCIYSNSRLQEQFREEIGGMTEKQLGTMLLKIASNVAKPKHRIGSKYAETAAFYDELRNNTGFLSIRAGAQDENAPFFEALSSGSYEHIIASDITKNLNDGKGPEKKNELTICGIEGIKAGGKIIKAHDLVLKLRGENTYKSSNLAFLDIIKEYYVTCVVNDKLMDTHRNCFLRAYGVLLDTAKIHVNGSALPPGGIAVFLSKIVAGPGHKALNCRVPAISYPWHIKKHVSKIMDEAKKMNLKINLQSLVRTLAGIYFLLFRMKLNISACDLVLMVDHEGKIADYRLFDLEKAFFEFLFGETHPLTRNLIDYNLKLPKRGDVRRDFEAEVEEKLSKRALVQWINESFPEVRPAFNLSKFMFQTMTLDFH